MKYTVCIWYAGWACLGVAVGMDEGPQAGLAVTSIGVILHALGRCLKVVMDL